MSNDRTELLRNIFTGPRFTQIGRWVYFGVDDDGARIGVATATLNPGFFEYALNVSAEQRVLAAKPRGKAD